MCIYNLQHTVVLIENVRDVDGVKLLLVFYVLDVAIIPAVVSLLLLILTRVR